MSIKRVSLSSRPVARKTSRKIAYEVSRDHIDALNRSIARKVQRNDIEKSESRAYAAKYTVK